jgi:hypothetical protein
MMLAKICGLLGSYDALESVPWHMARHSTAPAAWGYETTNHGFIPETQVDIKHLLESMV